MPLQIGPTRAHQSPSVVPRSGGRVEALTQDFVSRRSTRAGALAVLAVLILLVPFPASSHTPHDPVNFLALSDAFDADGTAFIVVHNELKRTLDGGATWHRLEQGICGLGRFSGLAASRHFSADRSLVVSRTGDGLYVSHDGGDTWRRLTILPRGLGPVNVVSGSGPQDMPAGFAAIAPDGRVVVSEDAGMSWVSIPSPAASATSLAMATGSDGELRLALGTADGAAFHSADRGLTWDRVAPGVAEEPVVMLAFESGIEASLVGLSASGEAFRWHPLCAADPDCAGSGLDRLGDAGGSVSAGYLSVRGGSAGQLVAARRSGEIVGGPAGARWMPQPTGAVPYEGQADKFELPQVTQISRWSGDGLCAAAFSGLYCSSAEDPRLAELESIDPHEITGLALAPDSEGRSVAVATFNAGGWVSHDGGESWARLPPGAVTDHFWAVTWPPAACGIAGPVFVGNRGLIWFDPAADAWNLATPRSGAPGLSDRVLGAWRRMTQDVPPPKPRPKVFGTVASSGVSANDCRILMGTRYEGVWSYDPTGDEWDALGPSKQRTRVASIVREAGRHGLVASFVGRGLSEFGHDRAWVPLTGELPAAATRARPFGAFKAAQAARFEGAGGVLLYGSAAGLYVRSGDGLWSGPVNAASAEPDVISNPVDSVAVIADAAGEPFYLVSIRGRGLFFSRRPDDDYAPARLGADRLMPGVRWIVPAADARDTGVVIAASPEGLYRSADGGQTWAELGRPR